MNIEISLEDLLKNGSHFGHSKKRWNPKMGRFIYGEKNGTHIIDLRKSLPLLENSIKFAFESAKQNKKFLFVSTKKQHSDLVKNIAEDTGNFYVNFRWLGGMLTNWNTVKKSINTIIEYETILSSEESVFTKKELGDFEKKKIRLEKTLGGIMNMKNTPDVIFIIDTNKEHIAVLEAKKLGIPIIGIIDTNCDPDHIDYPIPANDDGVKSVQFILDNFAKAIKLPKENTSVPNEETSKND
ncbi:30S ribosomal protein S2 [Alphaproteobacteria bacterium]|nr:30S ribosomal protein S2 [Alphaproteobacteria bacterium]